MAFHVGQKVACVDASEQASPFLVEGATYVVEKVGVCRGEMGLDVEGVKTPGDYRTDSNTAWYASRFRPVVERKTDISIFTEMLNPSRVTTEVMLMADHLREIAQ